METNTNANLDAELSVKARGSLLDLSGIHAAQSVAEVADVGGQLLLKAKGNAELAAVQLAMRARASSL